MIRRSTVVYVVLLLGLVGAYFFLKNREKPADIELTLEPTSEVSYLFSVEDGIPTGIRLEAKSGDTVEVARGEDNAWMLKQPVEANADQGAVEAAASQITTMQVVDTLPTVVDLKLLGLEVPEYVLTIKFTSGAERTLEVGVLTPTESGYYVRDRETMDKIMIVSTSAIDPLTGLLTFPPYLETPTPSQIPPTETITPIPVSPTPEADTAPSATAAP